MNFWDSRIVKAEIDQITFAESVTFCHFPGHLPSRIRKNYNGNYSVAAVLH